MIRPFTRPRWSRIGALAGSRGAIGGRGDVDPLEAAGGAEPDTCRRNPARPQLQGARERPGGGADEAAGESRSRRRSDRLTATVIGPRAERIVSVRGERVRRADSPLARIGPAARGGADQGIDIAEADAEAGIGGGEADIGGGWRFRSAGRRAGRRSGWCRQGARSSRPVRRIGAAARGHAQQGRGEPDVAHPHQPARAAPRCSRSPSSARRADRRCELLVIRRLRAATRPARPKALDRCAPCRNCVLHVEQPDALRPDNCSHCPLTAAR